MGPGNNLQYKYAAGGGFYLSPVTALVWDWARYQAVDGEYVFQTADGVRNSFACTSVEEGHVGVGCSNGPGAAWKVFSWQPQMDHSSPDSAETQVCQDHPDAFENGACGQATVYFRSAPPSTVCNPERVADTWNLVATDKRVADPEEDRFDTSLEQMDRCGTVRWDAQVCGQWEWRSNEMTLEECKTECYNHDQCNGIEFEDGKGDGVSDCIMIRRAQTLSDARNWKIYGKPAINEEFYFGTALPTNAGDHAILDDGTGFKAGRDDDLDYGWDCDGDTNVDYSGGRRGTSRDGGLGIMHFDRSSTCSGDVNWQLAVTNGDYHVHVDFGEEGTNMDLNGAKDMSVHTDCAVCRRCIGCYTSSSDV